MKLIALNSFCIGAGINVAVGEEFEAPETQAKEWIWKGWVRRVVADPPPPQQQPVDQVRVLDTNTINRDPKIGPSKEKK